MPEMDGYELHQILQEKSADNVPIMFMTADESDDSESKGFEVGAADYIRKPFKPDVLIRRVDNILKNINKIHGLKMAADIDPMTGLLNKSASQRKISEVCNSKQGVLMMIDLDSFKLVNDIYGHGMGDKILIRFAELIKKVVRSSDLAGRMGGDEFIAFCQNVHDESIIAQKTKYLNEQLALRLVRSLLLMRVLIFKLSIIRLTRLCTKLNRMANMVTLFMVRLTLMKSLIMPQKIYPISA